MTGTHPPRICAGVAVTQGHRFWFHSGKVMADLGQYLVEFVEPTVTDFANHPRSVRHAFLACVVVFHSVDYLAFPRKPQSIRQALGKESAAFKLVDDIAHAFKHVRIGDPTSPRLIVSEVIGRPPGAAGIMAAGISRVGDPTGGVTLFRDLDVDVLRVVAEAVNCLRSKVLSPQT